MHLSLLLRSIISSSSYPVGQVRITTCTELYKRWRSEKLMYRKAPIKGLNFVIDYVDTAAKLSKNHTCRDLPLILALHGAPGTYQDFTNVIKYFDGQNVRIVAPNFPDCKSTIEKGIFRNSAEEKAELLSDFLNAIGISRIDLLLTHSSALYPGILLYLNNKNLNVRSLAMLHPPGHKLIKATRPYWLTNSVVQLYYYKLGRIMLRKLGVPLLRSFNVKVRLDNLDNVVMAACAMVYSGFEQFESKLQHLNQLKKPTLMLFSEDDRLIDDSISFEMAEILGATREKIWCYDKNGMLVQPGEDNSWLKVIALAEGSHYSMWKFPDIVNSSIEELLQKTLLEDGREIKLQRPSVTSVASPSS